MALGPLETTPLTEAFENANASATRVMADLSDKTQQVISQLTASGGTGVNVNTYMTNVMRLNFAAIQGAATMWASLADNLVLVKSPIPLHWAAEHTYDTSALSAGLWTLAVTQFVPDQSAPIDPIQVAIELPDGTELGEFDNTWDGACRIVLKERFFVPCQVQLTLQATHVPGTSVVPPHDLTTSFTVDWTRLTV